MGTNSMAQPMHRRLIKNRRSWLNRKGLETIEVALTLPLLTFVMFTTIQINHRWHVEKMLKLASYEALKAGAAADGSAEDVEAIFEQHAAALGINNAQIDFVQSQFDNADTGDYLWVRGIALANENQMPTPVTLPLGTWMSSGVTWYRKEGL